MERIYLPLMAHFKKLLEFAVKDNNFSFNKYLYEQIGGVARALDLVQPLLTSLCAPWRRMLFLTVLLTSNFYSTVGMLMILLYI